MSLIPIENLASKYVYGLNVAWGSATTLTVSTGGAMDSTNTNDIVIDESITINGAVNGANGLDTGSLANATWYGVFVIASSFNLKQPAAIITASSSPLLPEGYDVYYRIGWGLTDGSAEFLKFYQVGNGHTRKYLYDAVITELNAQGSATFADVDLSSSVPSSSQLVILNWLLVPNTAGNSAFLRVNGSSSTTNQEFVAPVVAPLANTGQCIINTDSSQIIEYKTDSADDDLSLFVVGYEDTI